MLCDHCLELFAFSDTDTIIAKKKEFIEHAQGLNFSPRQTAQLRCDLERYQACLALKNNDPGFPCPWDIQQLPEPRKSHGGLLHVLPAQENFRWSKVRHSALSTDCELCLKLDEMIRIRTRFRNPESILITAAINIMMRSLLPVSLIFQLEDTEDEYSESMVLRFKLAIAENSDDRFRPNYPLRLIAGESTGDQTCLEILCRSLAHCLSTHTLCGNQSSGWIPSRLLDVHPKYIGCESTRIVETRELPDHTEHDVRYLTLSHVWGKSQTLKLLKSNYKALTCSIPDGQLPRRFLDAVHVTRQLGIRYIWIDSLCIIQDDREDWAHESVLMDQVYRHGICNIAACEGVDSNSSLFLRRRPDVGDIIHINKEFLDQVVRISIIPDWPRWALEHSPLYQRGWVVQERLLSPRAIHFSKYPFFSCSQAIITETSPPGQYSGFVSTRPSLGVKSTSLQVDFSRWWIIVEEYTKCALTVSSDKLVAIAGIAKAIANQFKQPYVAGLWGGDFLLPSLLWSRKGKALESSVQYRAPSWSWASVDGVVSNACWPVVNQLVDIISVQIVSVYGNDYGELKYAEINLRGFLFDSNYQPGSPDRMECRMDNSCALSDEDCEGPIFFLPLTESSIRTYPSINPPTRMFCGIYVRKIKQAKFSKKNVLKRVGCAQDMEAGGGSHPLSLEDFERLLELHSHEEPAEDITLV
ncbi:heterokaryon incompatibility protein-domain-containing protein [Clohesyomyces aquaticus]|uniref:Heterokaryon incompatibility protein-domain-containing protein n=1 Tax=Clohesyomyces aquaticus TaxID=1231657 RepID=A0A1Y1ZA98_9PLEO|nr:heterokaryon incompatibility protein-domain-containing protein [Clohesyomyces aquaticus]